MKAPELPNIGCPLLRIEFSYMENSCLLHVPPGACVDMDMALNFVQIRFPDVISVYTITGDKTDTLYRKIDSVWTSFQYEIAQTKE